MLGAFAKRENRRIAGLEHIIDQDTPSGREPGGPRQRDIRADADGEDDKVCWQATTICEENLLGLPPALDRGSAGTGSELAQ